MHYIRNSVKILLLSNFFIYMLQKPQIVDSDSTEWRIDQTTTSRNDYCRICFLQAPAAFSLTRMGLVEQLKVIVISFCTQIMKSSEVCRGMWETYAFSLMSVVKRTTLGPNDLCNYLLECGQAENPQMFWNISLLNSTKPKLKKIEKPNIVNPKFKILHLTDIHIDHEYAVNSIANCDNPTCCKADSKSTNREINIEKAAYWGSSSKCNLPLQTAEAMLDHIAKNEEFDIIIWTGDIIPHDIWKQKEQNHINEINKLTELFEKYFPNKTVYSVVGNHDAFPANLFPTPSTPESNIDWLYEQLSTNWIKNGLPSDTNSTILKGGFYTTLIAPGFRLVSLNTNFCYHLNVWLYIDPKDPFKQLEWFVQILDKSETHNEKVIVIGHIHPGSCLLGFGKAYYKIVNRYENTISNQFFGHSHFDHFELFYKTDENDQPTLPLRPTNVAFIAPSVTTYSNELNEKQLYYPAYRIYTLDGLYNGSTFSVFSHTTIYLDLIEANKLNISVWKKEYDTINDYGLESLFPDDLNNLVNNMMENLNNPLTEKFLKYYYKSSIQNFSFCDTQCRVNHVCKLKQARYDNFVPCRSIDERITTQIDESYDYEAEYLDSAKALELSLYCLFINLTYVSMLIYSIIQ